MMEGKKERRRDEKMRKECGTMGITQRSSRFFTSHFTHKRAYCRSLSWRVLCTQQASALISFNNNDVDGDKVDENEWKEIKTLWKWLKDDLNDTTRGEKAQLHRPQTDVDSLSRIVCFSLHFTRCRQATAAELSAWYCVECRSATGLLPSSHIHHVNTGWVWASEYNMEILNY